MAHSFDNGLHVPQRTRIRRGAVTLLSGLKRSAGGYLVDVIPYGGVVRTYTDTEGVQQIVATLSRAPSIAVAVGDRASLVAGIGGYQERGEIDLLIYFSNNNARSEQRWRQEIDSAGLASDTADPGLDVILDHAKELLIGQLVAGSAKDIKQIRPEREEELVTAEAVTIWLQTYKVTTHVQISEFRTVTQLLTSLRMRAATNPLETTPPAAKIDGNSIDIQDDGL